MLNTNMLKFGLLDHLLSSWPSLGHVFLQESLQKTNGLHPDRRQHSSCAEKAKLGKKPWKPNMSNMLKAEGRALSPPWIKDTLAKGGQGQGPSISIDIHRICVFLCCPPLVKTGWTPIHWIHVFLFLCCFIIGQGWLGWILDGPLSLLTSNLDQFPGLYHFYGCTIMEYTIFLDYFHGFYHFSGPFYGPQCTLQVCEQSSLAANGLSLPFSIIAWNFIDFRTLLVMFFCQISYKTDHFLD